MYGNGQKFCIFVLDFFLGPLGKGGGELVDQFI